MNGEKEVEQISGGKRIFIWSIYFYIIWISLQQVLSTTTLFILICSTIIAWNSNWPIVLPVKKVVKQFCSSISGTNLNKEDRLWSCLYQYLL